MSFEAETEKVYELIMNEKYLLGIKSFGINVVLFKGRIVDFMMDLCCKLRNSRLKEFVTDISSDDDLDMTPYSYVDLNINGKMFTIEVRNFDHCCFHRMNCSSNYKCQMTLFAPMNYIGKFLIHHKSVSGEKKESYAYDIETHVYDGWVNVKQLIEEIFHSDIKTSLIGVYLLEKEVVVSFVRKLALEELDILNHLIIGHDPDKNEYKDDRKKYFMQGRGGVIEVEWKGK